MSHLSILSPFMTYSQVCNKINPTGARSGAGTAYPSGAPGFTPRFWCGLSILSYNQVCNKSNTTGATRGAGTVQSSGAPDFTLSFQWGSCCSIISFLDHCFPYCPFISFVIVFSVLLRCTTFYCLFQYRQTYFQQYVMFHIC